MTKRIEGNRKRTYLVAVIIIFLIKISQVYYLSQLIECQSPDRPIGSLAIPSGDTYSYTGAMENYISKDSYYFNNGRENVYAGRMPHYSVPYLMFRNFLGESDSLDAVVIFQVMVESIAILVLSILLFRITRNTRMLWFLMSLMILSLSWTNYSSFISPESLSTSVLVFFVWFYFQFLENRSWKNMALSGLFLAVLVTLKAYFGILFFIIGIELLVHHKSELNQVGGWRYLGTQVLVVSLPLIILLAPWVARNYSVYKKFVPFQISVTAGYNYTEAQFAYWRFLRSWGGDIIYWEKSAAACYFEPRQDVPCEFQFPEYALCRSYGMEEIEEVKSKFVRLQHNYSPKLDREVADQFTTMTEGYIRDRPFRYFFLTPLILTQKFLVNSGSSFLPIGSSNPCYSQWQMPVKLITSFLYWLSLLLGPPGLIILALRDKRTFVMAFIPLFLVLFFPVLLRSVEWRFFQTSYPFLILGTVITIGKIKKIVSTQYFEKKRDVSKSDT